MADTEKPAEATDEEAWPVSENQSEAAKETVAAGAGGGR